MDNQGISSQELFSDAEGNIKPLAGIVMSGGRTLDAWRADVMRCLTLLGVTDNTSP